MKTATKQASVLHVVTIKASGIKIFEVEGSESRYYVTLNARGKISSCVDEMQNACKGFQYRSNCKHCQAVESKIAESKPALKSLSDDTSMLNGACQGFSLLKR